jgi:hypothetical protein
MKPSKKNGGGGYSLINEYKNKGGSFMVMSRAPKSVFPWQGWQPVVDMPLDGCSQGDGSSDPWRLTHDSKMEITHKKAHGHQATGRNSLIRSSLEPDLDRYLVSRKLHRQLPVDDSVVE